MTDEEINRKFDVVAEHLASLAVGQQALEAQVAETNKKMELYAETQREFIQFVKRHIEEQGELNKSMRETDRRLAEALSNLAASVSGQLDRLSDAGERTDARLDRLTELMERHVSNGHGG